MKFTLMAAVAIFALAASAKTTTPRTPAQVKPVPKAVQITEKASICHAIQARYHSTNWDKCGKTAKFSRQKDKIRVSVKTKKGTLKCNAELRSRGRFFDVSRLKCD